MSFIFCHVLRSKSKKTTTTKEQRIIASLRWTVKEDVEINARSGIYFLRTSLAESEKILWESYNTIREIEYSNRVLKTDLDLRPIYHKKDETSMAHLNLGLLAYWLVNTIRFQLKKKEILEKKDAMEKSDAMEKEDTMEKKEPVSFQWKEIVRIMNTQKAVTTLAQNKADELIMVRRCTSPGDNVKLIYDKLGYKYYPFKMKKSVVHKSLFEKKYPAEYVDVNSS